jgi:hypothetical protein
MHKPASNARFAFGLAVTLIALGGRAAGSDDTAKVREQIRAFESGTGRIPPSIRSVLAPDGKPAYLFTAPCCDIPNPLYDAEGRFICAPTGGFTGLGDGKCPDWVHDALRQQRPRTPAPAASAASGL